MDKVELLKASRTYNFGYDRVTDDVFADSQLLDPRDLLQVRYEIVRAVDNGESPERVAPRFGVSGMTARRCVERLAGGGILALVPERSGPRGPRALGAEAEAFVDAFALAHPLASGREVHEALEAALAPGVSQRTVERRLALKRLAGGR